VIKKFICVFLMTLALTSPVTANAQSSMDLFGVTSDVSPNIVIAPGDSFKVTNKTQENIKVKLDHLENIGDSSLFDALTIKVNERAFKHLSEATSDWVTLKRNETYVFNTEFSFPDGCQNEYQSKDFKARLFFRCEAPEGSVLNQNGDIVQTGDTTNMGTVVIILLVSGIVLVVLGRGNKLNKQ